MGKLAQWEFGAETVFDGQTDFAEIEKARVFSHKKGRLVIWATPMAAGPAVLLSHQSDSGRIAVSITGAGAVVLACTPEGAQERHIESPRGMVRVGEPTEITLAWGRGGEPDRMSVRRAGLQGSRCEIPLEPGMSLSAPAGGDLVIGAAPHGVAPFFHGKIHRVTLWDSPGVSRPITRPDVLDLSGQGAFQVRFPADSDAPGFIDRRRADGRDAESLTIDGPSRVVPSFIFGTHVATPEGARRVEGLRSGEAIETRDNGVQTLRWVGHSTLDWQTLRQNTHLWPILIRKGALGDGLPLRDMQVSPNHRLWVRGDISRIGNDEKVSLVAAKHLVNNRGIYEIEAMGVTYVRLMFDSPQSVLINGVWAECYQPGAQPEPKSNAQRNELYELFPKLKRPKGSTYFD